MSNFSFITVTNQGYLDYTRNMILSLQKLEIYNLKVYCIGQKCYDDLGYENKEILDIDAPDDFQTFRKGEWNKIMFSKFHAISNELEKGNNVLFSDGDIVFLDARFQRDVRNRLDDNDILFQNDKQNDLDDSQLCCGFMYIKCNDNNKKLFDPRQGCHFECDQIYINQIKDNLNYNKLPLKRYPNGCYFGQSLGLGRDLNPYMIHFNYIVGDKKKEVMKKLNYWYI
jgi:hypothetical protein